jgi:pimeloyl-ACP methyl ester carboxylesterase
MKTTPRVDDRIALPDGRLLAYAEFGDPDGRPVLFLHGTPGYRLNIWATDAELRSAGVRLVAPDRPGVGRSTPQPDRRLLDWADDIHHLADTLGLERFALVGFSNGGPHAAACAHTLGPASAPRPWSRRCHRWTNQARSGNWAHPPGTTLSPGGHPGRCARSTQD